MRRTTAARGLAAAAVACLLSGAAGAQGPTYNAARPPAQPPPQQAQQPAGQSDATKLTPQQTLDRLFVSHAAMAAVANDQLGHLAAKKAVNPAVRRFGMEAIDLARTNAAELQLLAKELKVLLPDKLPGEAQATIDKVAALEGKELDRRVLTEMWSQNNRDRSLYKRLAEQAQDEHVRAWGVKALEQAGLRQKLVKDLTMRVVGAPASGGPGR